MSTRPGNNDNTADLREKSISRIRQAVSEGLSFDQACSLVFIDSKELKEAVVSESLRTMIAEFHISKGMPLKQLAMRLRLSMSRLLKEKEIMDREPEEARVIRRGASTVGRAKVG